MEDELILRDLYYSPKTGFRSIDHLHELAIKEDPSITKAFVKEWLQKQKAYTKHKRFKNPQVFQKTLVRDLGEQVQVDLIIFMSKHSGENRDYKYILVGIALLSRFAFAVGIKAKNAVASKEGMQIFLERFEKKFDKYPRLMQFDDGLEFNNKDIYSLLEKHDIKYFSNFSKRKAAIIERFNRTLKEKILKLFESTGEHNWIDYLQDLIDNYNTQKHRSIGMSPSEVNEENKFEVWHSLFGKTYPVIVPKYKVGDKVRVLKFDVSRKGKKFIKYWESKN